MGASLPLVTGNGGEEGPRADGGCVCWTVRRREKELATLLQSLRPFFSTIAKAKTGKIGACSVTLRS
jgi:hypothetical protein